MVFYGAKFKVMRYGRDDKLKHKTNYFTKITSELVERFENLCDLGVILFDDQMQKVLRKVRQKVGWTLRTVYSINQELIKTLYIYLVVPYVDYC